MESVDVLNNYIFTQRRPDPKTVVLIEDIMNIQLMSDILPEYFACRSLFCNSQASWPKLHFTCAFMPFAFVSSVASFILSAVQVGAADCILAGGLASPSSFISVDMLHRTPGEKDSPGGHVTKEPLKPHNGVLIESPSLFCLEWPCENITQRQSLYVLPWPLQQVIPGVLWTASRCVWLTWPSLRCEVGSAAAVGL